jgi:type IV secretory pathway TrbF-like protein
VPAKQERCLASDRVFSVRPTEAVDPTWSFGQIRLCAHRRHRPLVSLAFLARKPQSDAVEALPVDDARERGYESATIKAQANNTLARIASVSMLGNLALTVLCATIYVRASQPLVDIVTVDYRTGEVRSQTVAQPTLTAPQNMVRWELAQYVTARRTIPAAPNGDYSQTQKNIDLVYSMSVDAAPYHERQDVAAMYAKPETNPKYAGKAGVTRTVIGEVAATPLTETVWSLSWWEQTTNADGTKQKPVLMLNKSVTISPPHVQPGPNAAGVFILHSDLPQ